MKEKVNLWLEHWQQELTGISNILGFIGHAQWEKIKYLGLPITTVATRGRCGQKSSAK
jgi:hypothetical protein